jgi:hypothetical protein
MKKSCAGCNKEFQSSYPHAKFCSKECRFTKCVMCDNLVDNPRRDRKTCSNTCRNNLLKITMIGESNPNFGNRWNEHQKQSLSKKNLENSAEISRRVKLDWENDPNRRQRQSERAKIYLGFESGESHPMWGKARPEEVKLLIGKKSKQKFTREFKENFRKTMEDAGHWIPIESKTDYEIYFKQCEWIHRMFDIVPNGLYLINEHGVFNAKTNTKGVVRDHIVGRKFGFENRIFPEIMRHPANCAVILHSKNTSKGQRGKGRPDTDMSLEDLFDSILNYNQQWIEQEICVKKIADYKDGDRWKRDN